MNTTLDFIIKSEKENRFGLEIFNRNSSFGLAGSVFDYDVPFLTDFKISRIVEQKIVEQKIVEQKDARQQFEDLKAFGSRLYEKLFTREIEKIWREAKEQSDFLCLCLRMGQEQNMVIL